MKRENPLLKIILNLTSFVVISWDDYFFFFFVTTLISVRGDHPLWINV